MRVKFSIICATCGILLLIISIVYTFYVIPTIKEAMYHLPPLKNGSKSFIQFTNSSAQIKFRVNLFNLTNPEVVKAGKKAIMEEIGPYVYDVKRVKVVQDINEEKETISYFLKDVYRFNSEDSGIYSEDDYVTTINLPLLEILNDVRSDLLQPFEIDLNLPKEEDIFRRLKVGGFLFKGNSYDMKEFLIFFTERFMAEKVAVKTVDNKLIFSMFHDLNQTNSPFEITSGIMNTKVGEYLTYNGKTRSSYYKKPCNLINGTDLLSSSKTFLSSGRIYTFLPELCRSVFFVFDKHTHSSGFAALRYYLNHEPFDKSRENNCFCEKECPPRGTNDLKRCRMVNLFSSLPHFYLGEQNLRHLIDGFSPHQDLHESFIYLEPRNLVPLHTKLRFQLNANVINKRKFARLANVTSGYYPVLWYEQEFKVDDEFLKVVDERDFWIETMDQVKVVVTSFGMFLIGCSVVFLLCCTCDCNRMKSLGNDKRRRLKERTSSNPNLYPQLKNKNLYDGFTKKRLHKF